MYRSAMLQHPSRLMEDGMRMGMDMEMGTRIGAVMATGMGLLQGKGMEIGMSKH